MKSIVFTLRERARLTVKRELKLRLGILVMKKISLLDPDLNILNKDPCTS
jgi:hypothetical protein